MAPKRVVAKVSEHRWAIVVTTMIVMAVVIVILSLTLSSVRATNSRQEAALQAAQSEIASQQALRASEAKAARQAKVLAGYAECKARIAGTVLGNGILDQIRGIITDIQAAATNPAVIASLKRRALALPTFPTPTCQTGPPPKKKKKEVKP